ncbi:GspH/FimT family pseudopilin [Dasania marina]|uniref:GspH/FimT family pseudopilin n=1 Tax=Dasania marina TaxID=471499 RepID=UPI0003703C54|nr:GspH/FimT family pseudopilin [Dasania marina]
MNKINRKASGFTLIELMITISIVAILVAIAVPSMQNTLEKNSVSTSLSEFSSSLRLARAEAIKRSRFVVVCPSSDQATCTGTWAEGWLVFEDVSGNNALDVGTDDIIRVHTALSSDNTLLWSTKGSLAWSNGVASSVQYNSRGLITSAEGTFKICSRSGRAEYARALVLTLIGSLRYGIDGDNNNIYEDESGGDLSC